MLEIHVRLPSQCRTVLWPGTIAQKQHNTSVQETCQWNIAFAFYASALRRNEQAGRKSVSRAQSAGAVLVPFVETRDCALQVICIGVDSHCTGLDPGEGQPPPGFVVVLVQGGVVDAARVSLQVVADASALRHVGELAALAAIHVSRGQGGSRERCGGRYGNRSSWHRRRSRAGYRPDKIRTGIAALA